MIKVLFVVGVSRNELKRLKTFRLVPVLGSNI